MKKIIYIITTAIVFASCKKEQPKIEWPDDPMPIYDVIFLKPLSLDTNHLEIKINVILQI